MDILEKYIHDFSSPEHELLQELDKQTHLTVVQPRMISGHVQGKLLEMIVRMLRPANVLEIGTFTGYSALCMAAGLSEDGVIDTIEIDDELEALAASFFNRSAYSGKIKHHIGSALEIAPTLGKQFDLIFIDGDKREYPAYYQMIMGDIVGGCVAGDSCERNHPLVKPGSIILADNILWYGKVVEPIAKNDLFTQGIVEFNDIVRNDDRVESVILPIRDGINLIRVK